MNSNSLSIDLSKSLLKADKVAQILGVSRSKAYLMMKTREFPIIQIGKSIRVHPDDLSSYIVAHATISKDG